MREPTVPGWAEEQTPTPFLYHKQNLNKTTNSRFRGVWLVKNKVITGYEEEIVCNNIHDIVSEYAMGR